jgi:hemolysin III
LFIREPTNTWTHFAGMLASIPATAVLLRLCRGDRVKFWGMLIYGISLILCYGCSALFHATPDVESELFIILDHLAIFILIAGTVTPIAMILLRGWARFALLAAIWGMAAIGIIMRLCFDTPLAIRTGLYLAMGWIGCSLYFQLVHRLSHAKVVSLWLGGVFYSVGALINLTWTKFPPELSLLVGPHEVFHVFVLAGSACHYYFMIAVMIPYRRLPAFTKDAGPPAHAATAALTTGAIRSGSSAKVESRR